MRETYGDIWRFHPQGWVVIPTNIGWRTRDGSNVMGAGLARQASVRFPQLAMLYGGLCKHHGALTPSLAMPDDRVVMFPVKPLNRAAPHLSWQQGASLHLIRRSAQELAEIEPTLAGDVIAVPWVGCGNGGLSTRDVYPILWDALRSDRFVLVKGALGDPRAQGHALRESPTRIFSSALSHEAKSVHKDGEEGRGGARTRATDRGERAKDQREE